MSYGDEFEDVGDLFERMDVATFDHGLITQLAELFIHVFDGELLLELDRVVDELHA